MTLARCRVVLVRPHYAGNLGSVCRAMANFGLSDLVLVNPVVDVSDPMAARMAVHAAPILERVRVSTSLSDAVGECGWVLAMSGETRGLMRQGFWGTPEQQLPAVLDALTTGPAALVFGPEPSGLTADEVALCHAMAFIPADDAYPSLNLAMAVGVVLYELRKQFVARGPAPELAPAEHPADYRQQEVLFARLREGLESVRFLWDERADGLFHVIRQVIARARPTAKELKVFHGVAAQLRHVARAYGVRHPRDGRPPAGLFRPGREWGPTRRRGNPRPAERASYASETRPSRRGYAPRPTPPESPHVRRPPVPAPRRRGAVRRRPC